jgi:hypothetical protein
MLSSHLRLGLPSGLFPSGLPTKPLYTPLPSPICATCPTHFLLLDFITRTIVGEEYRLFSFAYGKWFSLKWRHDVKYRSGCSIQVYVSHTYVRRMHVRETTAVSFDMKSGYPKKNDNFCHAVCFTPHGVKVCVG